MNQILFDSHFHIIDPRFPLVSNQGFLPEPFTVKDYQHTIQKLGLNCRDGAVVSGSFQAFDQTYLVEDLQLIRNHFDADAVRNILYNMEIPYPAS